MSEKFYGKYRGIVDDNNDPMSRGRITAKVPDVFGDKVSAWALPCAPFSGSSVGFFALPKVGAGVWIEFEHGDPDYPIWSGGWFGDTDIPSKLRVPPPSKKVLLVTEGGHSLLFDDTPGIGGITLETSDGAKIVMNMQGIEINDGKGGSIKFTGPKVSINDGAIDVI